MAVVMSGFYLFFPDTRRSEDQRVLSDINDILAIRDQAKHPGLRLTGHTFGATHETDSRSLVRQNQGEETELFVHDRHHS